MDSNFLSSLLPSQGPSNVGAQGVSSRPTTKGPESSEGSSPAFRVLLEQLERQSQSLSARNVASPDELPEVVDEARSSLESALSIGDQLLEAYRANLQRGEEAGGAS